MVLASDDEQVMSSQLWHLTEIKIKRQKQQQMTLMSWMKRKKGM